MLQPTGHWFVFVAVLFHLGAREMTAAQGETSGIAIDSVPTPAAPDSSATSRDDGPYFYKGLSYGSDANIGPLDVLLNRGFAVAQQSGRNRKIFDYRYGTRHVANSFAHPLEAIERAGGWWEVISTEVLPLAWGTGSMKWAPNYFGHVIEGGIAYRQLWEWFEARNVRMPGLLSGVTTMAAAMLNELYEHPYLQIGSASTLVDLLLFDTGGILLFSNDSVARFFPRSLKANVWPTQAAITLPDGQIMNNGNNLTLKFPLSPIPSTSIFMRTGLNAQLGLTLHSAGGLDFSAAVGMDAIRMLIDPVTGEETADLKIAGRCSWTGMVRCLQVHIGASLGIDA